jgi:hypothetical protein
MMNETSTKQYLERKLAQHRSNQYCTVGHMTVKKRLVNFTKFNSTQETQ